MPATIQSDVWKQFSCFDDKKSATCEELLLYIEENNKYLSKMLCGNRASDQHLSFRNIDSLLSNKLRNRLGVDEVGVNEKGVNEMGSETTPLFKCSLSKDSSLESSI